MRLIVLVLAVVVVGCATSKQNFVDDLYQVDLKWEMHDGERILISKSIIDRTIQGKNLTNSPPFGGKSVSEKHLNMTDNDWTVNMGDKAELTGGELDSLVQSISDAVVKAGGLPISSAVGLIPTQ